MFINSIVGIYTRSKPQLGIPVATIDFIAVQIQSCLKIDRKFLKELMMIYKPRHQIIIVHRLSIDYAFSIGG